MQNVTVLGAGAFGTALAQHLAQRNFNVTLWCRRQAVADHISKHQRHPQRFDDMLLAPQLQATADLPTALKNADTWLLCVPSQEIRNLLQTLKTHWQQQLLIIASKGLEHNTLMTLSEVCIDILGVVCKKHLLIMSGPSFAHEIMQQQPTALVMGAFDLDLAKTVAAKWFCEYFRVYSSQDVIGIEMAGALKNIMAIAYGAMISLAMGHNPRAAFLTRALAEMRRLAVAKGGDALTLMGLAGMGDLVLTCTGEISRNRSLGVALGQGTHVTQAMGQIHQVAEGFYATQAAHQLAQQMGVDTPIIQAVHRVLYHNQPIQQAMAQLLQRIPEYE